MPLRRRFRRGYAIRHHHARACVQLLWIETVPPRAGTVRPGELERVVAHSCLRALGVVPIRRLVPVPRVRGVVRHAEAHALGARDPRPGADNVLAWSNPGAVPRVVRGVVHVEIVVVVGHRHEVLGASALIQRQQLVRIPMLRLPPPDDIQEARARRMPVGGQVVRVLRMSLDVHVARVPVAALGLALRTPMRPEPEFGITKPVGRGVVGQGLPRCLERREAVCDARIPSHAGREQGQRQAGGSVQQELPTRGGHDLSVGVARASA